MRIRRCLSMASLLLCLLWPQIILAAPRLPEGPTGNPTCSDLRDNNRDGLRDSADTGCAAAVPFTDCDTGKCAEAADGLIVAPLEVVSDTDVDGTVDVVTLPFGQSYTSAKLCFGINFDFTGYVWLRVKGAGSVWVTIPGDAGHEGTPDNHYLTKVDQAEYGYVPIGLRVNDDYQRGAIEGDFTQRAFVIDGTPTASSLCIAMTGGLSLRSPYLNASASATPILPTVDEPSSVVHYQMFELGANPAPTVDSAVWEQANSVPFGGEGANLPLDAPATMKAVYKEGSPDRIYVRWEKTLASQDWLDVATDSTTIASYTAAIVYLKMDSLVRGNTDQTWILAASPQPDYYDATWPMGVFSTAANLSNVTITSSVSGSRRRIQLGFDSPTPLSTGQQFLCGFRDNERLVGGTLKFQYAFNVDPTLGYLGLCEAAGTIITPADTTPPTVSSTVIDCPTSSSCTVTVTGADDTSASMTSTLQVGTATGNYTLATQGPIGTTGDCTTSCTSLFTLSGLSAATTYYVLATMRDQAGNTDAGSEVNDTTGAAGATFYVGVGGSGTTCSSGSPCHISRLGATSEPQPSPGETWLLKNGTSYPTGTVINCAAGSRNGTASQKITVKAENERAATIFSSTSTVPWLSMLNCSHWNIEGIVWLSTATNTHTAEKFECSGCAEIGFRKNLLVYGSRGALASQVLMWKGPGKHVIEDNECYSEVRYCFISKQENGGTIFRRNYTNNRGYTTPSAFIDVDNFDHKMDAGITVYPGSNHIVEDNISENNSTALNNETDNLQPVGENNRSLGNISINDQYGQKAATHDGSAMRIRNWDIRDLLVVNPSRVGIYMRATINTQVRRASLFITNTAASGGIIADKASDQFDPGNLSIYVYDSLVHGVAGKKGSVVQTASIDDWRLDRVRLFNNTGTTPTSSSFHTNITTSDPAMGTAKVCIPVGSNLRNAASDGGHIGADVLYRYQGGVKSTANKRWTTSKGANCPDNVSGIYPYGMGACVAGLNDTVSTSLVGVADRLGMTITQVEGSSTGECNASSTYFP